jgi:hypothetical protein
MPRCDFSSVWKLIVPMSAFDAVDGLAGADEVIK